MKETISPIYRFCRFTCFVFFRLLWRMKVYNAERVPADGPIIISPNHRSNADPPLIGVAIKRPVHFMAKRELFEFKPFGWLITQLNAHPLNRAGDIGAMKLAMKILADNGTLIIFPEGGRSYTDEFKKPKAGVGMLAVKTGTKVVPAYVHNSGYMSQFRTISVIFGEPLDPTPYDYQTCAEEVMRRIENLRKEFIAKGN